MLSKHRILTQVAGHGMDVLKILPPFIIGEREIDWFIGALDNVLAECRKFPGPMWELGNNFVRAAIGSRRSGERRAVTTAQSYRRRQSPNGILKRWQISKGPGC